MRRNRRAAPICFAMALWGGLTALPPTAGAEDAWNPFAEKDARRAKKSESPPKPVAGSELLRPTLPPMEGGAPPSWGAGSREPAATRRMLPGDAPPPAFGPAGAAGGAIERGTLPPLDERSRAVERGDLTPVTAGGGTGVPLELWQGLDVKALEAAIGDVTVPPVSPTLNGMWRRLWTAEATPPAGGRGPAHFEALRRIALLRSGFISDVVERKLPASRGEADAAIRAIDVRVAVAVSADADIRGRACSEAKTLARGGPDVGKAVRSEMLLVAGYCAGVEGNAAAAGLAAELARAEEVPAPLALAALDALGAGTPLKPELPPRLSLMDYRYLVLAKAQLPPDIVERAEPALLAALAAPESEAGADVQLKAAEQAVRLGVLGAAGLAAAWSRRPLPGGGGDPLAARGGDSALRRAALFQAAGAERTPMRKARLSRALLDEARRARLELPAAAALAKTVADIDPVQELSWFAETAIEIDIAGGRYERARDWVRLTGSIDRGGGLQHWLALADLADPSFKGTRGQDLAELEHLAVRGRLDPLLLHRLATVLDALDYQIPIPLWEAASRTPQPATGHLPHTGVLTELQDAAKKREFARTVLLVMRALGPGGVDGAHLIALGDSVRALRRAGLDAEARRLALEAVWSGWPRMAGQ